MKPRPVGPQVLSGMSCAESPMRLLRFGIGLRKVALGHMCDDGCEFNRVGNVARHSESGATGGVFEVLSRRHGYPPHMG